MRCAPTRLVNLTTGKLLASDAEVADTFWRRFRGLMLRRRFKRGKALLFKFPKPGRYSVHMFFVRFPIDLIYLDSNFTVVEIRKRLKPWRIYRPKRIANYLIEIPAGQVSCTRTRVGNKILLKKSKL